MNLIDKTAPDFSGAQNQAVEQLRDYVAQSLEQLDFTLSNLKNRVGQMEKASAQTNGALELQIASISAAVGALEERVSALEQA